MTTDSAPSSRPASDPPGVLQRAASGALRGLRAADPGFVRARVAVRTGLSAVAGAAVAASVAIPAPQPVPLLVLGGLIGLLGSLTMPPGGAAAGAAHLGRLVLAGGLSAVLAALLAPTPAIAYAGLLGVMGAAAWATRWGPLGTAVGIAGFMAHVSVLFLAADPADAPWLLPAALAGGLGGALATLVVLPDRPAVLYPRMIRTLIARLDRLVDQVLADLVTGVDERARRRILARLAAVQAVALDADGQLDQLLGIATADPSADADRGEVLSAEVLADHLVWSVVNREDDGALPSAHEAAQLRATWRDAPETGGRTPSATPVASEPGPTATLAVLGLLRDTRRGLVALLDPASSPDRSSTSPSGPSRAVGEVVGRAEDPANSAASVQGPLDASAERLDASSADTGSPSAPAGRKVVQAVLAGSAAIVLGLQLSPTYWYWAVIGAFVVVITTPSRGVGVRKAIDRTIGTAIGAAIGLVLGTVLAGRTGIETFIVVGLLFGAFWVFQLSHTWLMAMITILLALAYDLLGRFSPDVLFARLGETALGALVGGLVAFFVLPTSTRSSVDAAVLEVLDALDDVLDHLVDPDPAPSLERIRALDRAVSELRTATEPLMTSVPTRVGSDVRAARLLAAATRFRARALATATERTAVTGPALEVLVAVRHRLHQVRRELGADDAGPPPPRGDVDAGDDPVTDVLRAIDARLAAYLTSRGVDPSAGPGQGMPAPR